MTSEESSLAAPLIRSVRHASDQGPGHRTRCRASLLLALAIVSNGAFLFGYHLAVINGPLPQIAEDFDVANSAYLQGMVRVYCKTRSSSTAFASWLIPDLATEC